MTILQLRENLKRNPPKPFNREELAKMKPKPGSLKGAAVTVWVDDASGYLDSPPLTLAEAASQADAAMVGAIAGSALTYLAAVGVAMSVLRRRRMAAWEADWVVTAPAWNRQRW